jgi:hypothetical protein
MPTEYTIIKFLEKVSDPTSTSIANETIQLTSHESGKLKRRIVRDGDTVTVTSLVHGATEGATIEVPWSVVRYGKPVKAAKAAARPSAKSEG